MMLIPTHHFRDIERKPEYLQPEKCAPPPFPGPAGTMWFIRDGCGIACAIVTWFLVLYAEFVVLFVMLIPSRDYVYSIINGIVFNLLAFLALASHCRAMLTDPVSMSGLVLTSPHSVLLAPGMFVACMLPIDLGNVKKGQPRLDGKVSCLLLAFFGTLTGEEGRCLY